MACRRAAYVAFLCFILQATAVCARQRAVCNLTLKGSSTSVTSVVLDCKSTSLISVAYNADLGHNASSWTGISLVGALESCKQPMGLQGTAVSALLYFCGDYDLQLLQPVVSGLQHVPNNTAILAFGGNTSVAITDGTFAANSGTAVLTMQQAMLHVERTTFSKITAYAAAAVFATDRSIVYIRNSTVTGSQALAPVPVGRSAAGWHCIGGAVLASGQAYVSLETSKFTNNTAAFGGVLASNANSSASISGSIFSHNSAGVAGGMSCAEGNSSQVIIKSYAYANLGGSAADLGAGGALFLRDGATATIIESAFIGNKAAMWGGALYVQNYTRASFQSTIFDNNSVSSWGGAANIYDAAVVTFDNCSLSNNKAAEGGGGGVMAGINSSVTFSNCVFNNNSGKSGGSLYANGLSQVSLRQSQLLNSSAMTGAAMHCEGNTTVSFDGCSLVGNTAKAVGGGLYMVFGANVIVRSSQLQSNRAPYGGGVMAAGNSRTIIMMTEFCSNSADNSGGAVYTDDTATAFVQQGCQLTNNSAATGGGLFCIGNSSVTVGGSSVHQNTAGTFGGGADIGAYATVILDNSSFSSNAAETGGAMRSSGNSNTSILSCQVAKNVARGVSGAIYASGQAQMLIAGTNIHNNTGQSGGAVFQDTTSSVTMIQSNIANNSATMAGGAIYSRDNSVASVQSCVLASNSANDTGGAYCALHNSKGNFTDSVIENNVAANAGGALYIRDSVVVGLADSKCTANFAPSGGCANTDGSSSLDLSQSSVQQNSAYRGGGVYLDGSSGLSIDEASNITGNKATTRSGMFAAGADFGGVGGGVYLASANFEAVNLTRATKQNTAPFGSDVGVSVQHIAMVSNSSVDNFASRLGSDEGLLQLSVNVSGPRGLPCHGAQVQAVLDDNQFLGINRSDSLGKVYMILKVQKPPGHYDIALSSPDAPWVPGVEMELQVRSCVPGEVTPSPDACLECPVGYFSLDPSKQVCDVCPSGADCSASFVVPLVGMWSSTADSVQVHCCPNPAGCQGNRSTARMCAANITCRTTPSSFSDLLCSPEYHGHLCGKCVGGYAPTAPFVCRKCMNPALLVALYVVAGCMMLLCIRLLCFLTRMANHARCRPAQVASSSRQAAELKATDPALSAALQPTDLIKPLILFLQWQLIVATASGIDWKAPLSWMLTGLGWIWSASSPETLSLQCLMTSGHHDEHETPPAFKAALFHLLIPFAMLAFSLIVDVSIVAVQRRRRKATLARLSVADSVLSNAVVAAGLFLPTVVRTLFGLFACVPIDQPAVAPAKAAAMGLFWASDPSLQCFHGMHKAWALGLGIPFVLLICVCLPAGIVYKTVSNRTRLDDPNFIHNWGSLYLSYKPQFCFFEGVTALSTIILVAISVFGLNLGQFYQLLVLDIALLVFFAILLGLGPYAQPTANSIAVQAVALLMLTCYAGMSLIPASRPKMHHDEVSPGPVYATVVSVVVVVLNVLFVVSVLWRLARLIKWQELGSRCHGYMDRACSKCQGGMCMCGSAGQPCDQLPIHSRLPKAGSSIMGPGSSDITAVLDGDKSVKLQQPQAGMEQKQAAQQTSSGPHHA